MSAEDDAMDQQITKLVRDLTTTMQRWGDEAQAAGIPVDHLCPMTFAGLAEAAGRFTAFVTAPEYYEATKAKFIEDFGEAIARNAPEAATAIRQHKTVEGMKARLAARFRQAGQGEPD